MADEVPDSVRAVHASYSARLVADAQVVRESPVWSGMTCVCGVVMPVSEESVAIAKRYDWYALGRRFQRMFYAALGEAGVDRNDTKDALYLLGRHAKKCLQMTPQQVRGAWGVEKGIFANGGFRKKYVEGREAEALLMDDDKDAYSTPGVEISEDDWRQIEYSALAACNGKPDQVGIDDEFRWISSRLGEWPDFDGAPSVVAIKTWLKINKPGNESLVRDFLNLVWSRRLAPGDKGKRAKEAAFAEDAGGADVARDEELEKRLFGESDGKS